MKIRYIILIAALIFVGCNSDTKTTIEKVDAPHDASLVRLSEAQYSISGIQLGRIEQKNMNAHIQVNGILDVPPQNLVSISILYGGNILKSEILQGMKVRKGQLLALIRNAEFLTLQQDYLDAKNKLEYLKLDFERETELKQNNISSVKIYQQAKTDYQSQLSRLKSTERKLKMLNIDVDKLTPENITESVSIYSPINGYVIVVNFNMGSYVSPQDVLFQIVDTEHIHAELSVFEKDVVSLSKGMKVRFVLVNDETKERTATVFLINRKIEKDRTVRVHAHLDKEDSQLIPGMYLKAWIETGTTKQNAVLDKALVSTGGKDYIFVSNGTKKENGENIYVFKMIEVKKGITENGFTAIKFIENIDLKTPQLVTNGAFDLISKAFNTEEE